MGKLVLIIKTVYHIHNCVERQFSLLSLKHAGLSFQYMKFTGLITRLNVCECACCDDSA